MIDLDEDETPQGNVTLDSEADDNTMAGQAAINHRKAIYATVIAAAAAAAIVIILVVVFKKNRKKA